MKRSVRLSDDTGNAEMEPFIPVDRVVSIREDGSCYLSDQCFMVTEDMLYVEPVVEEVVPVPTTWDKIKTVLTTDVSELFKR